jgi:hypothetical protein
MRSLHRPSRKRHPWRRPDIEERTTDESITTEQVPEDEAIREAKVDVPGAQHAYEGAGLISQAKVMRRGQPASAKARASSHTKNC